MRASGSCAVWLVGVAAACGSNTGGGPLPDATLLAPETILEVTPAPESLELVATFEFRASDEASFLCALDDDAPTPCSSPHAQVVEVGLHVFSVTAVSIGTGLADPTPAVHYWRVDATAPDTTLVLGPAPVIASPAAIELAATDPTATFECSLDGALFAACPASQALEVAEGHHMLLARAVDGAGNRDPSPVTVGWTLDVTGPAVGLTATPPTGTPDPVAVFSFVADEGATFECQVDGVGAPQPCVSPWTSPLLGNGSQRFVVRALDLVGNRSETSYTWDVVGAFVCGNGVVDPSVGEECDDGNLVDGDACTSACVAVFSCFDGVANGDESDVDCGGACATPCAPGQGCATGADCFTGVCGGAGACVAARCDDGVVNGAETGVDCGGGVCDDCPMLEGQDGALVVATTRSLGSEPVAAGRTFADAIAYRVNTPTDGDPFVTLPSGVQARGIAVGDEVLVINLRGEAGDLADVGNYEFAVVDFVATNALWFRRPLTRSYDGAAPSLQRVAVQRVPHYTSVTVASGGVLTTAEWDGLESIPSGASGVGTGVLAFRVAGALVVDSGGAVSVAGRGYRNGQTCTDYDMNNVAFGTQGEGRASHEWFGPVCWLTAYDSTARLAGAGGGVRYGYWNRVGGGGGGGNGSAGGDGSPGSGGLDEFGQGGEAYGAPTLAQLFLGAGGGSGAYSWAGPNWSPGGRGGGIVLATFDTLSNNGIITADGGSGTSNGDGNGGGGGGGGSILLRGTNIAFGNFGVTSQGGVGGGTLAPGGAGGFGRIRAEYTGATSGRSAPPASLAGP